MSLFPAPQVWVESPEQGMLQSDVDASSPVGTEEETAKLDPQKHWVPGRNISMKGKTDYMEITYRIQLHQIYIRSSGILPSMSEVYWNSMLIDKPPMPSSTRSQSNSLPGC
jgi:hypothetical protein